MNSVFSITCAQKILEFLIKFPGTQFLAAEIQRKVKLSKGAVNQSLRELAIKRMVNREKKGKIFLYSINYKDPVIKQFKILKSIELLNPLIAKLAQKSEKITLFGSSARGEDTFESDIDLFVLTNIPDEINDILKVSRLPRKLQPVIRKPLDFTNMGKKEPVFYEEINRGIILWEKK